MVDVYCGQCGLDRSSDLTLTNTKRTPCSDCGAISLQYRRTFTDSLHLSASLSTALTPGQQHHGWQHRWEQIQQRQASLGQPRTEPRSAAAIHAAAQELLDFYVLAYHLKDRLITERAVPRQTVEDAITSDPTLALLADLANLDKHSALTRPSRSGHVPTIHVSDTSSSATWELVFRITHNGATLDGFDVARDSVAAWRSQLMSWGLIS